MININWVAVVAFVLGALFGTILFCVFRSDEFINHTYGDIAQDLKKYKLVPAIVLLVIVVMIVGAIVGLVTS